MVYADRNSMSKGIDKKTLYRLKKRRKCIPLHDNTDLVWL